MGTRKAQVIVTMALSSRSRKSAANIHDDALCCCGCNAESRVLLYVGEETEEFLRKFYTVNFGLYMCLYRLLYHMSSILVVGSAFL